MWCECKQQLPQLESIIAPKGALLSGVCSMAVRWQKLSPEEIRLAKKWYEDDGLKPSVVASRLGRSKSTLTRLLVKQVARKQQGRPPLLSKAQVDFLQRRLHDMIVQANAEHRVTVAMLRKSAKIKASCRVILEALHERGVYFRKLREKPVLTPTDVKERLAFAKLHKAKSAAWWNEHVHGFLDGKHFKTYLTPAARTQAAQHRTFGAFRAPGQGLSGGYVKPKQGMAYNTGSKSCLVMGAVGRGKVLLWHAVPGGRWSGQAAADMYKGALKTALAKTWPRKRAHVVLEDNDPTGFQSSKGKAAKTESGINTFAIPKRSPDLNPMDYSIWSEINRRMRRQELKWTRNKRETRAQYLTRLRRTATNLPSSFITKAVGDMRRRCKLLLAAEGRYFEEGRS